MLDMVFQWVVPTAIFVFEDGRITISNRAAAQMLGAGSPDDLINKTISEFLHPGYKSDFSDMVEESLRPEKPYVESQLNLDSETNPFWNCLNPLKQSLSAVQKMLKYLQNRRNTSDFSGIV